MAVGSFSAQQQTLRRLNRAFEAFFGRVRKGETPGYPRFRSRRRFDTVDHVNGDGAKWHPTEGRWARAYFRGVGHLKTSEHRTVTGVVSQISLKREGRRWYVILIETHEPEPLPETGSGMVGIDVGITRFLTTSDGEIIPNPRFAKTAATDLAVLQQQLARCDRGSGNYRRTRRKIAKLHRSTKNRRLDFHHKTARSLVDRCDSIAIEKLNVKGMMKRAAPKPDGDNPGEFLPNGTAAKTGLNRSIGDVGWAQFATILVGKAVCADRPNFAVNPAGTSIDCHRCGKRCTRPSQDTVICPDCGPCDADLNGAKNIAIRGGLASDETALAV